MTGKFKIVRWQFWSVLRIRDVFIPDPRFGVIHPGSGWGSNSHRIPDPDPQQRVVFLTQKSYARFSEIWPRVWSRIQDLDIFSIPDLGVKKHWILDPVPQHWFWFIFSIYSIFPLLHFGFFTVFSYFLYFCFRFVGGERASDRNASSVQIKTCLLTRGLVLWFFLFFAKLNFLPFYCWFSTPISSTSICLLPCEKPARIAGWKILQWKRRHSH